jgi:hypothetical protein
VALKVGLDIDGVLLYYPEPALLQWLREKCEFPVDDEEYWQTDNLIAATGWQSEHLVKFFEKWSHVQKKVSGAHSALHYLVRHGAELHLITGRSCALQDLTMNLLQRLFYSVQFSSHWFGYYGAKADMVRKTECQVVIEDSRHEIESMLPYVDNTTCIIQFPRFSREGEHQPVIDDSRVIRLHACDKVDVRTAQDQMFVWEEAWREIRSIVLKVT